MHWMAGADESSPPHLLTRNTQRGHLNTAADRSLPEAQLLLRQARKPAAFLSSRLESLFSVSPECLVRMETDMTSTHVTSTEDTFDISDVIAVVSKTELDEAATRVDRLLTDQSVTRKPMNMVAFD